MERKRIYLSSPTMHGEEQAFVQSAFDTNWVAPLGPNVDAFEKEMADYIGGGYAAALSAGTAAIHLAVILAGVKEGDVVFAQSLTFAASVNPACYEKAKPVFIDSEPDTWNMDPVALEKAFEKYPHPAAVIAVHLYGTPSKIDRIRDIRSLVPLGIMAFFLLTATKSSPPPAAVCCCAATKQRLSVPVFWQPRQGIPPAIISIPPSAITTGCLTW